MRKNLLTTILVLLTVSLWAQEGLPFYKHYLVGDAYLINPSYAGQDPEVLNVTATYANQWADLPESPNTQTLSAHATVVNRLAFGLYVFHDRNGLSSLKGINLSAAYHIPISSDRDYKWDEPEDIFSFGLSYNNFSQSLDIDRVIANDPNDPLINDSNFGMNYFNFGASFRYAGAFGGISVLDIPLKENESVTNGIEPLPAWYNFILGYTFYFGENFYIYPSVVMNLNSNSARKFDVNLMSHLSFGESQQGLDLGVSYRQDVDKNGSQGLTMSPIMKLKIGELKVGFSYDLGLSDIAKEAGNGFMFSLGYNFGNPFNPDFR